MIYIFTGNGKGKTTSAIGQALRVIGQGKKAAILQFIKSRKWPTGEEKAISFFGSRFYLYKGGRGFVGIMGDKLPRKVHKEAAQKLLKKAEKIILSKKFDLVILDEINVALSLRLISLRNLLSLIKKNPSQIDLILTGRSAPKKLIQMADLATEFKEIKHPFQKGVWGKKGREF